METLRHLKEKHAQELLVIDAPRTRAQEGGAREVDRGAFMAKSSIKDSIIA